MSTHGDISISAAAVGRPSSRAGTPVAGDQVDDLDGPLALLRDGAAQLGGPANPIQAGASTTLIVRRARRPWSVLTDELAGMAALVGSITEADLARNLDEHRLAEFVEKVYTTA
jgi:hypothetical protein